MSNKIKSLSEAVDHIKDGMTLQVGGFYGLGTPTDIIDEIIRRKIKDLTIITNDTAGPGEGVGRLVSARAMRKIICSYPGTTPELVEMIANKEVELELVPQGTLAERIRCAGFGLGGVLTPTGLGTVVADGKEILELNGAKWLYDTPLHADVAILAAYQGDEAGNLVFREAQRNFCQVMAYAADLCIASIDTPIAPIGSLDPDKVRVPAPIVDILVQGGKPC